MAVDTGACDVVDVRGGKGKPWGDDRGGASGQPVRSTRHFGPARFAQTRARRAMQYVVDAHVGGLKATQALIVRCVHDGIDGEPADVAVPNGNITATA